MNNIGAVWRRNTRRHAAHDTLSGLSILLRTRVYGFVVVVVLHLGLFIGSARYKAEARSSGKIDTARADSER